MPLHLLEYFSSHCTLRRSVFVHCKIKQSLCLLSIFFIEFGTFYFEWKWIVQHTFWEECSMSLVQVLCRNCSFVATRRLGSPRRLGGNRIHYYLKALPNYFNNILKLPESFNGLQSVIKNFRTCCLTASGAEWLPQWRICLDVQDWLSAWLLENVSEVHRDVRRTVS